MARLLYYVWEVNFIMEVSNWISIGSVVVALFSFGATFHNYLHTRKIEKNNENYIKLVLTNSTMLALFDIDVLILKVYELNGTEINFRQLNYQVESLKDNLNNINKITFNTAYVGNYQVYRKNLQDIIYKINDDVVQITQNYKDISGDTISLSLPAMKKFLSSMVTVRHALKRDHEYIKNDKNLLETDYVKKIEGLEKKVDEVAKKYRSEEMIL